MMNEANIKVVEQYLDALRQKDLSLAPLADDLQSENSMLGKASNAADFRASLESFLLAINDIKIHRHICEGEYVATHWEADTEFGAIPIMEMFRVRNGKIIESTAFFDPRPILG